MNRLFYLCFIIVPLLFAGCKNGDEPEPPAPEADSVVFSDAALSVDATGGDVVLRFTSNRPWTIGIPAERENLHGLIHTRSGEPGNVQVVFSALPNVEAAERSTTFRVVAGRANAEITLRQNALGFELPSEEEVREYLMRLFNDTDGPNWRFKPGWGSDLPINQWGSEVKYENGLLELNLGEHNLKGNVDMSGCKALVSFRAQKNQIAAADFTGCPLLEKVDLTNCGLEKVKLDGCYSLEYLYLGYNNLTRLDVGWSRTLKMLQIPHCALTELDLPECVMLEDLACHNNRLLRINLPVRQNLQGLWCYSNELTNLDMSRSPNLSVFNCSENEISRLDVSDCPKMRLLWFYANRISSVDLSSMKEWLSELVCYSNRLEALDLSGYRMLGLLHCSDNSIDKLNIKGCVRLGSLYCSYNRIEELDFEGLDTHIFTTLDCSYNRLQRADIVSLKRLKHLWCEGNRIGGEIPEYFDNLEDFGHDARYEYGRDIVNYLDNGYGWWYPGEPASGRHAR